MTASIQNITRGRLAAIASVMAAYMLAGVMIYAAMVKSADLPGFSSEVRTLSFLPRSLREWLPLIVPILELVCGTLILLPRCRAFGIWVTLSILVVFTAVLVWKFSTARAPCLNCLGSLRVQLRSIDAHRVALVRNIVLIWIGVMALILGRATSERR